MRTFTPAAIFGGCVLSALSGCNGLVSGLDNAGALDSGVSQSQRGSDAGPVDIDAGPVDAGELDAGVQPHDAGMPADSGTTTTPMTIVGNCGALPDAGVWQHITPPDVVAAQGSTFAFAVDPIHAGTVYLGTIQQKLWKSTDCGATWVNITTGRNGAAVSSGMNWSVVMDPMVPDTLYVNAGYGANGSGMFKSINGGVDWDVVWPPANQPTLSAAFTYNFANTLVLDPSDHLHALLTFHETCNHPGVKVCIAETMDGGGSWVLHDGDPRWTSDGEGVKIMFLEDAQTWLWGSQADGLWRTANGGQSWDQIVTQNLNHLQSTQVLKLSDGTYVAGGLDTLWTSPKGTSAGTWTAIAGTGPLAGGLTTDGVTLYMSNCYYGGFCSVNTPHVYFTATESDPTQWAPMEHPPLSQMQNGGVLGFDVSHHILYSSNLAGGFWRVTTQ